jgi:hypothetical protein
MVLNHLRQICLYSKPSILLGSFKSKKAIRPEQDAQGTMAQHPLSSLLELGLGFHPDFTTCLNLGLIDYPDNSSLSEC